MISSRFALAPAAVALVCASAGAFDRYDIQPGDTVVGDILVGRTFDELAVRAARGSVLTVSIANVGGATYRPALGVYDYDYRAYPLIGVGATSVRTATPLESAEYRILIGGQGSSVGAYRVQTSMKPALFFAMKATAAAPSSTLTFGAYAGFEAAVVIKWKGPAPVTLHAVTGPGGAELTSTAAAHSTAHSTSLAGLRVTALGDHVVTVDVPPGTLRWSVSTRLTGRLARGTTRNHRTTSLPEPPIVAFPTSGRAPLVTVAGEVGGPNVCLLSATGGVPDAAFLDGGSGSGGCSRAVRDAGDPPSAYLLYCLDGFFAEVAGVERDGQGRVTRYDAPSIRTPQGSGSATLSDFTYDAQGHPAGWTELRRFAASGRSYELVFSRAEYFSQNGYCKAFRVVARQLPDGVPRTYDYAPFR